MKSLFTAFTIIAFSSTSFAEGCFESPEYKANVEITKAAKAEEASQIEKAVNFLVKHKGLSAYQAFGEIMRFSSTETLVYDMARNGISETIHSIKPESPEDCSELINLQKQLDAISKDKIQFVVNKIIE